MGRLTGRLFVGFTLFLITFIGYSSQIFIIWPWYGRELSVQLLSLLLPFNVLLAMLLWNYYLCITVSPGHVPATWKPDLQDEDGYEVKKLTRGPRYCRACENYKPPRAHHCRQCKRCVLRMDHHCPWVNNCVGHFNYGHFIRFLFYVDIACSYHLVMVTKRVMYSTNSFWDEPGPVELIFIILNYTFCVPVLIAVGCFSLYHFKALLTNTTTIESWEKDKVATLVRRGKVQEIKFPYNIGVRRNIASVLGDSPLRWCWPTIPQGTGLKYPLTNPQDTDAEAAWPPKGDNAHDPGEEDYNHVFNLPESPWTYENGSLNPVLEPHNSLHPARRRRGLNGLSRKEPISSVPPYHPDYRPPGEDRDSIDGASSAGDSSSSEDVPLELERKKLVRRGSEGYEVHAIDREDMLRQHIEHQVHEPGRYHVYVPEPITPSESDSESEVPLAQRVEAWRTSSAIVVDT